MIERVKGNKSIFALILMSYLLVFIVPVLISLIVYFQVLDIVKQQTTESNMYSLNQIRDASDQMLIDMERVSTEIGVNSRLKKIRISGKNATPEERLFLFEALSELSVYRLTNNFMQDIFLYNVNKGTSVGTKGSFSGAEILKAYYEDFDLGFEDWVGLMENEKTIYLPLKGVTYEGIIKENIMFVKSISLESGEGTWNRLIINISKAKFMEKIKDLNEAERYYSFIVDKNDNIIVAPDIFKSNNFISYSEIDGSEGIVNKIINGDKSVIVYCSSNVNDWKYVSVLSERVYLEKVVFVKRFIFSGILFCILMGIFLVYYFSRRNYNNIYEITAIFSDYYNDSKFMSKGFMYIKKKVKEVLEDYEMVKFKMEQHHCDTKFRFYSELLRGKKYIDMSPQEYRNMVKQHFGGTTFAVMAFSIDDYEKIFFEDNHEEGRVKYKNAVFIITNVIEELVQGFQTGVVIETDDLLACIICVDENNAENIAKRLRIMAIKAQEFITLEFNIMFTIAISNPHSGGNAISLAYEEVITTLQYKMLLGKNGVICYADLAPQNINYTYTIENERKLINCIKSGFFDGAQDVVSEIFDASLQKGVMPIQMVKCLVFDVVSTVIKVVKQLNIEFGEEGFGDFNIVDTILGRDTLEEIKTELLTVLNKICKGVSAAKKNPKVTLIDKIKEYVEANYNDYSLSVSSIANYFNITDSYLSRQFKRDTGKTLLEYIHLARIENAKKLLNAGINVSDIATKIGYCDSNAFIRVFKKYEKVTPGQYKGIVEN